MTTCVDVTEVFRTDAPAAVHIDGTARPQIVHRESQPEIHALLTAMYEQTGIGVLINTSFNLHEEPIVCTPDESIRAAKEANLDALWISDQLLLFL
jgi:carbamoyltransferase